MILDTGCSGEVGQTGGMLWPDGGQPTVQSARLEQAAMADRQGAALVARLLGIGVEFLRNARLADGGGFPFRLDGVCGQAREWRLTPSGNSLRYTAITALGLLRLPEWTQRQVLAGESCDGLVTSMCARLADCTSVGDVALVCWAAAEAGHQDLPGALARLADLDQPGRPSYVVDAAWVVSALAAARRQADVRQHLRRARQRLLTARGPALYPHLTGRGPAWHRAHVGSFADQVYPVQALARLHRSAADPEALSVANSVAAGICAAQGEAGQWWWHYDSRTGAVVEGYPVYSVHQYAMAPMALLDLADAGGADHLDAVCRGLAWLSAPPEAGEPMVLDEPPVVWRKVARSDPRKLVRGLRAASSRVAPGVRLAVLDRVFPPAAVDHECRPYEFGWLPLAWYS